MPKRPLPSGLLDKTRWTIPHADVLLALTEGRTTREAVVRWADQILPYYDALAATGFDELPIETGARDAGTLSLDKRQAAQRAALQQHIDARLTIRQIATLASLTVPEVVGIVLNPRAIKHADAYAALEDALAAGALDTHRQVDLVRKYPGVTKHSLRLCVARLGLAKNASAA